jgi:nitrogen fixation-related uncharacterized protein
MPRVVPSQIVSLIDHIFPGAKDNHAFYLSRTQVDSCATIVDLTEQLPSELIVLSSKQYSEFRLAINAIKVALEQWKLQNYNLGKVKGLDDSNPVITIRKILSVCPDEFPSKDTAELSFIDDNDLRANLEIDISATNQALSNGEWKAATVLAGSVIEALLLWALKQYEQEEVKTARDFLLDEGTLDSNPGRNLNKWDLHSFIEVGAKLGVIGEDAAQQARLARKFRNLIHPGREKRLGQKCDRGTALAAVAAVVLVIRELSS